MIERDTLKIGNVCWYATIEFSSQRGRINKREKPTRVTIKNIRSKVDIETESGRNLTVSSGDLYETKEDAIEHWNSVVNNALDWIESDYQRKKRLIEKEKL